MPRRAAGTRGAAEQPAQGLGTTPTPTPTRMNRRTGRYWSRFILGLWSRACPPMRVPGGASCLVPSARLELAQLSPLPPQDSVSTNFTTTAVFCRPDRHEESAIFGFPDSLGVYPEIKRPLSSSEALICLNHLTGSGPRRKPPAQRAALRWQPRRSAGAGRGDLRGGARAAGAAGAGAARSSTLQHAARFGAAAGCRSTASASVQAKNTPASTAVVRDRKLALPLAPNRLPEAAAAEGRAHVGALAVLDEDEADHAQRRRASARRGSTVSKTFIWNSLRFVVAAAALARRRR